MPLITRFNGRRVEINVEERSEPGWHHMRIDVTEPDNENSSYLEFNLTAPVGDNIAKAMLWHTLDYDFDWDEGESDRRGYLFFDAFASSILLNRGRSHYYEHPHFDVPIREVERVIENCTR